jgi:hypothetical protein
MYSGAEIEIDVVEGDVSPVPDREACDADRVRSPDGRCVHEFSR